MEPSIHELKALFLAALERPAGLPRAAYLDEACGGDAFLRAQVDALLKAHAEAGEFLGSAAGTGATATFAAATAATVAAPESGTVAATIKLTPEPAPGATAVAGRDGPRPLTERPGDRIGPYKLLQQIGAGGMGVVFMAEQEHPVRRRIALKVIKAGMDTEQVVARFEA